MRSHCTVEGPTMPPRRRWERKSLKSHFCVSAGSLTPWESASSMATKAKVNEDVNNECLQMYAWFEGKVSVWWHDDRKRFETHKKRTSGSHWKFNKFVFFQRNHYSHFAPKIVTFFDDFLWALLLKFFLVSIFDLIVTYTVLKSNVK